MPDNGLSRLARGDGLVPRNNKYKGIAREAQQVYDDVHLAALRVQGAVALGGHIMDGIVELDEHRRSLAGDDPVLKTLLADIEAATVRQVKSIQNEAIKSDWVV